MVDIFIIVPLNIIKNMKTCIDCDKNEISERKRCRQCALIYNRERVKKYYKKDKKRYGITICIVCKEKLIQNVLDQKWHGKCRPHYQEIKNYNSVTRSKNGNTVARQMILDLGFVLNSNIIVHHVNENPEDNTLSNFWIMSRKNHRVLHSFLKKQWSLLMKINSSNLENCWDTLRDQLTTTWLEITNVNVIKITDIGQSAAEPLNENNIYMFSNGEGSETMYQTPKSKDMVKI